MWISVFLNNRFAEKSNKLHVKYQHELIQPHIDCRLVADWLCVVAVLSPSLQMEVFWKEKITAPRRGHKWEQLQLNIIIHLSILLHLPNSGLQEAGVYPRYHRVRGKVHIAYIHSYFQMIFYQWFYKRKTFTEENCCLFLCICQQSIGSDRQCSFFQNVKKKILKKTWDFFCFFQSLLFLRASLPFFQVFFIHNHWVSIYFSELMIIFLCYRRYWVRKKSKNRSIKNAGL